MIQHGFFIAIGPPKTGTTWLYKNLSKHPEVHLLKIKEIRHFWAREFLKKPSILSLFFDPHWHYREKRRNFVKSLHKHFALFIRRFKIDLVDLKWDLHYYFGTQDERWYVDLFSKNILSGDITPKYCELSDESILQIKELMPNCKIIIGLRDPIEREWSRTKANLLKKQNKRRISEIDQQIVIDHFHETNQHQANDYSKLIKKWRAYFDSEKVFIYHFEELRNDPEILFNKICNFLNIALYHPPDIAIIRNKGIDAEIPKAYLGELIKLNYGFIKEYAEKHPNKYSKSWVKKYQSF